MGKTNVELKIFSWKDTQFLINGEKLNGIWSLSWDNTKVQMTVSLTHDLLNKLTWNGKLIFKYQNTVLSFHFDQVNIDRFYTKGENPVPFIDLTFVNKDGSGSTWDFGSKDNNGSKHNESNKMTVADVTTRAKNIELVAGDFEVAHSDEDDLHHDVLKAIADGNCDNPAALAKEALKTLDIEFPRYCA